MDFMLRNGRNLYYGNMCYLTVVKKKNVVTPQITTYVYCLPVYCARHITDAFLLKQRPMQKLSQYLTSNH